MKTTLLLGVLFCILLVGVRPEGDDDDSKSDWSSEEEECAKELKLKKEDMQKIKQADGLYPKDNADFTSFMACYFKKMGAMDADGEIDYGKMHTEFVGEFRELFGKNPL